MGHTKFENMILLSLYGELALEEEEMLAGHLESCPRCREFKSKVSKSFPERDPESRRVVDQVIDGARRELCAALEEEMEGASPHQVAVMQLRRPRWISASVPAYAVGIAAFVMLAVGIAAGYYFSEVRSGEGMPNLLSEISSQNSGRTAISDVRFHSADEKSGGVTFSFNLTRRFQMHGSLEDKNVQKVLAYALVNSDNPGVRLRTIGVLDASPKPDKEIEMALIRAMKTDENTGVRREALLSLEKLPFDNNIKDALLYVLQSDRNPGMRVAAINALSRKDLEAGAENGSDRRLLDVLRQKSSSDQNRYVRMKAAEMLKEYKEL